MISAIQILSILGLLLSIYAFYVENKAKKIKNYKAICDISESASCGKAFTSDYSKLAGFSNTLVGMFFYIAVFLISLYNINYVFYLSILGIISTFVLAYILYFKLKNFCLVCTLVYVVNILIFLISLLEIYVQ